MGRPGAVLAFDDEDAGFGGGVGDVLVAGFGVADTTGGESFEVLAPVAAMRCWWCTGVSTSQHPGWPWTICTSTGKTFCAMRA